MKSEKSEKKIWIPPEIKEYDMVEMTQAGGTNFNSDGVTAYS